jgi:hypothetical protein
MRVSVGHLQSYSKKQQSFYSKIKVFECSKINPKHRSCWACTFVIFVLGRFEANRTTYSTSALLHGIRQSIISCWLINDSVPSIYSLFKSICVPFIQPLCPHLNPHWLLLQHKHRYRYKFYVYDRIPLQNRLQNCRVSLCTVHPAILQCMSSFLS